MRFADEFKIWRVRVGRGRMTYTYEVDRDKGSVWIKTRTPALHVLVLFSLEPEALERAEGLAGELKRVRGWDSPALQRRHREQLAALSVERFFDQLEAPTTAQGERTVWVSQEPILRHVKAFNLWCYEQHVENHSYTCSMVEAIERQPDGWHLLRLIESLDRFWS